MKDMKADHEWLTHSRRGAAVRRWHTKRTIHTETVGQHTYGVLEVLWILTDGKPSVAEIRAVMLHDIDEQFTGDTPAPAKWASNELRLALENTGKNWLDERLPLSLGISFRTCGLVTPRGELALHLSDLIDMMLFAMDERRLGNRELDDVFGNALGAVLGMLSTDQQDSESKEVAERAFGLVRNIEAQWKGMTQ